MVRRTKIDKKSRKNRKKMVKKGGPGGVLQLRGVPRGGPRGGPWPKIAKKGVPGGSGGSGGVGGSPKRGLDPPKTPKNAAKMAKNVTLKRDPPGRTP